ncbi:hypothetical protein RDI58_030085 [Solanum bulbocastanum]|uniref:RNase H type-1 domain-containing protein n=1 Tax=Solanum bulbocastanum TaxID=147425 RepID=A0AAN8SSV0_SOLBU
MEKWIELANHLMTRWRMGTESRSHKRMNGAPGPDRTRDSDNPGNRQKEMGRILESAQKYLSSHGECGIANFLSLDDILTRLGYTMPSRSWCCNRPTVETMQYLFLKSQCADKVWQYFSLGAGLTHGVSLQQVFQRWWKHPANVYLKPLYQALPCVVVWELWKRRKKRRYGGNISLNRRIFQVSATLHNLLVYRFPKMKRLSSNWPELVSELESYIPRLHYRRVCWEFPSGQWIKCNTDGASRGNPGKSGAAVVFRDAAGKEMLWQIA